MNVTVMLKATPKTHNIDAFVASGGYVTTSLWTEATYGFGGTIPYDKIANFVQRCPDVLLVEKEAVGEASVAYAAQQVGARTYVWNTLGLQGDPNASTAIVDTGIDGSHVDFSPGYGNQNFSKKIVGWTDQIGFATSPIDDNGHGSHVAGLAAGNGFFSVDASGYAAATWGANLTGMSGGYTRSGMLVNNAGTITMSVKWLSTGTAKLATLSLYNSGKNLNSGVQVASKSTPINNTWYTLSLNVPSIPSGGYDKYNPALNPAGGTGNLFVVVNMSWPYTPPSDGFSAWTGIAPQSKLVGVKVINSAGSGSATKLISGINWIISNRMRYHITVASMSLGFDSEVSAVNSAVLNLVNSGVTVVVAAGNDGSGNNYVHTPGSVDEVITVAAMNQFDNIASYSSQGGTSGYTGKTTKPDITAPGGSFYGVPLLSVDSNNNDVEGWFTETQANDAAPMQGTSMATPLISGSVQVLIQAMGGYANWNWTRSQALLPKMILLMTATETYPNVRELESSSTSPPLGRGGKDIHEGYGRVNLDVAVDALSRSYAIESVVTDTLGKPPTPTDISVLGQSLAWSRNVQLTAGYKYSFNLSVPAGADYDFYLYNSTGTTYGEPAIVAKSINATTGGTEQFWVTAPYTGTYYVVVKRATETTGSGTFTLASSGPANVTLRTPGLPNASNVVHYTQNSVEKTGSIVSNSFSGDADTGTTLIIDNPIYVSATQRYIATDPTSFTVQSGVPLSVNYKTQYYIAVNSDHGAPTASQWVDQGGTFTASVISPTEIVPGDRQWVCAGYSLDGGSLQSGTSYSLTNVQAAQSIVFPWKEQFFLNVSSPFASSSGDGWYDSGTKANAVLSPGLVSGGPGVQYVFTGWTDDASGTGLASSITMDSAKTAVANWKTQYYLTVSSFYGAIGGEGWYDSGSSTSAALSTLTVAGGAGTQYVFTGWSGDATGFTSPSNAMVMNSPKTAIANWKTQFHLNMSTNFGSVSPSNRWYDAGAKVTISATSPPAGSGERYVWNGWTGTRSNTDNPAFVVIDSAVTEEASWVRQYRLTVTSAHGSPTPISSWFDAGTFIQASVGSPIAETIVSQYVGTGWAGTGSVSASGTATNAPFMIDQPSSITWNWKTDYYLPNNLLLVIIPVVSIMVAISLGSRRRKKVKRAGEPKPTSSSPPFAAKKLTSPTWILPFSFVVAARNEKVAFFVKH